MNALHNDQYFDIRYKGKRFKNYVGVIQVAGLIVEILPEIDSGETDKKLWQNSRLNIIEGGKLKGDIGREVLNWYF